MVWTHTRTHTDTCTQASRGFRSPCQRFGASLSSVLGGSLKSEVTLAEAEAVKFHSSHCLANHLLQKFPHTSWTLCVSLKDQRPVNQPTSIHPFLFSLHLFVSSFLKPRTCFASLGTFWTSPLGRRFFFSVCGGRWLRRVCVCQGRGFTDATAPRT